MKTSWNNRQGSRDCQARTAARWDEARAAEKAAYEAEQAERMANSPFADLAGLVRK